MMDIYVKVLDYIYNQRKGDAMTEESIRALQSNFETMKGRSHSTHHFTSAQMRRDG